MSFFFLLKRGAQADVGPPPITLTENPRFVLIAPAAAFTAAFSFREAVAMTANVDAANWVTTP